MQRRKFLQLAQIPIAHAILSGLRDRTIAYIQWHFVSCIPVDYQIISESLSKLSTYSLLYGIILLQKMYWMYQCRFGDCNALCWIRGFEAFISIKQPAEKGCQLLKTCRLPVPEFSHTLTRQRSP